MMASNAPSVVAVDVGDEVGMTRGQHQAQSGSCSIASMDEKMRPQAGPLPSKRGEIGYREEDHGHDVESTNQPQEEPTLPARHPADRDHLPPPPESSLPQTPGIPSSTAPLASPTVTTTITTITADNSSSHSCGKQSFLSFFKRKPLFRVAGISSRTFFTFTIQLCALAGTIIGWVLSAKHMPSLSSVSNSPMSPDATQVFVHVTFGIVTLMQLIFLERTIFRLRAERFAYKHPSGVLPTSRGMGGGRATAMAFAPWNRPPLPTYAAALAQSGFGTGDVEDNVIAVPPPPAYGHTRGSTLILAGFMSDNLRTQRMRERMRSDGIPVSARSSWVSVGYDYDGDDDEESGRSRPVSYKSHDSVWEHTLDAHRALRLEETLSRLEEGGGRNSRAPGGD